MASKKKKNVSHSLSNLKSNVVTEKEGRLKFPPTIPRNRTALRFYLVSFLMILSFLCLCHFNNLRKCLEVISYGVLCSYMMEFLYRCILCVEEFLYHFKQRYGSAISTLLEYTFFFTRWSVTLFVFSLLHGIYCVMDHGWIVLSDYHPISFPSVALYVFSLRKVINNEIAPIYNSLQFEADNGLSYSSALAHSFYHGYLRLILPKTGREDKNLIEIIEVYSATHNVEVFPKLFILVPKSAECKTTLEGPNIEESSSLEEKKISVAAVKQRVYKNSVYKILDPSKQPLKRFYVCAEYATPLRTFYEALKASEKANENFRKHKDDIVLQFYLITRNLIRNDPDIRDICELIYYDDLDENGKNIDVSHILLRKVKPKF